MAYREEVVTLSAWCGDNDLNLNTKKTKELIMDVRKKKVQHMGLSIGGEEVERVSSFGFLGVHISEDLSWILCLVKKAQKRLLPKNSQMQQTCANVQLQLLCMTV